MRILHFNQFGMHVGGVEGYIADVSHALTAAGHETKLVSFASENPDHLMLDTVQVTARDFDAVVFAIEQVIADFRPDVAYLHVVENPLLVRWICGRLPTIAYVHSPYLFCPGYALYWRRSAKVCDRAAGSVCIFNAQIKRCCFGRNPFRHISRLRQVYALLSATSEVDMLVGGEFMRSRLIANGVSADKISLLTPLLFAEPVSEYMPPSAPEVILFAGRVTIEKGLRQLIQALASIQSDWQLIVAGDGPDRIACEQLAEHLHVAQRVEFAGWVALADMPALYRRCAFVVVPSLWPEPYGRIGPEAFSHGRPVVAYAVGGIPDWLEDGRYGYLAVPGNVDSLRIGIMRLLGNPDACLRMGRLAQENAYLRWNAAGHVQKLEACFQSAIGRFICRRVSLYR